MKQSISSKRDAFKKNAFNLKDFWDLTISFSLFLSKDLSKVKGQRVAKPTNERLPSPRVALARPTSGIVGWRHLKVPREGIDRHARSLVLSFVTGKERLSVCERERKREGEKERSCRPRRENCSESLPRILGQTEETYKADGVTASFARSPLLLLYHLSLRVWRERSRARLSTPVRLPHRDTRSARPLKEGDMTE